MAGGGGVPIVALPVPVLRALHGLRHAARHLLPGHLLALVDPFFLVSTVANVCNVVYSCSALIVGTAAIPNAGRLVLGLAVALDWITLVAYLKYNGNYYLLQRTFATSAPAILRNVAGSLPIFAVFALLGMTLFGTLTERFDGLPWSSITLFAVANGDVVRETFQMSLYYQVGFFFKALAQLIMYAFCASFIYAILKTTTAINEQSYLLVRPLPSGATRGARAAAIPNAASGRVDMSPIAYRLPRNVRRLLAAMQRVRDQGAALAPIVASAARSMPATVQTGLACCDAVTAGWYSRNCMPCYRLFCCCFGADWASGRGGGSDRIAPPPATTIMPGDLPYMSLPGGGAAGTSGSAGGAAARAAVASAPGVMHMGGAGGGGAPAWVAGTPASGGGSGLPARGSGRPRALSRD